MFEYAYSISSLTLPERSNSAVNQTVYLDYIKKRLVAFISKYHYAGKYVFWPECAKMVTVFFDDNDINYVKRFQKRF